MSFINPEDYRPGGLPKRAQLTKKDPTGVTLVGESRLFRHYTVIELDWNGVHALIADLNQAVWERGRALEYGRRYEGIAAGEQPGGAGAVPAGHERAADPGLGRGVQDDRGAGAGGQ